mgnify:FL=1
MLEVAYELPDPFPTGQAPSGALGGLWNLEQGQWVGEWYYTQAELQDAADGTARSGLPLCVLSPTGENIEA